MLIDTAQSEETRVAVIDGKKVDDFDFESSTRKPLRGNIYLARVTRVEPSLQAAFVEYGGNRHGFLAFSEIHPDYYQIPVSDREALQKTEREMIELGQKLELFQRGDDLDEDAIENEDDESDVDLEVNDEAESSDETDENTDLENNDETAYESDDNEVVDIDQGRFQETDKYLTSTEDLNSDDDAQPRDVEADSADTKSKASDGDDSDDTPPKKRRRKRKKTALMATDTPNEISKDVDQPGSEPVEDNSSLDDESPDEGTDENTHKDIVDDNVLEDHSSDLDAADIEDDDTPTDHDDNEEDTAQGEQDSPEEEAKKQRRARQKAERAKHQKLLDDYREARRKHAKILRNYKIQEVIKPRQILLIQVVKEERGNKGAALTSYLSLAGRYCVLMPNTARGGGISRKIPNASDRKRLRRIVDDLDVTDGMGLIIRTAGAKRTKAEIKRDYDYLTRLWGNIRDLTLTSVAPNLIYEEASLIKRAIRDLYDKDINKVVVQGEAGYREAKDFMKMLMPSHAKNVQPYKNIRPLFLKYDVEQQLDAMYQPTVRLRSGGDLVINQTEALIAVDVNSGKATRERNIESTALKTNLEAAQEVARQCKLRDLAGLIVIDFIDMEEMRNNRAVEKRLKDAMKTDRARIQIGRISNFGLMEMSRQRRRSGIVDGTTSACPTCNGSGAVRSHEMAALRVLRAIEAEAISDRAGLMSAKTSLDVALFILNHKRDWLNRIEDQYGLTIEITADASKAGDIFDIEKRGAPRATPTRKSAVQVDNLAHNDDENEESISSHSDGEANDKKKRRRRRKRRNPDQDNEQKQDDDNLAENASNDDQENAQDGTNNETLADGEERPKKRRRRGRRGGRRNRPNEDGAHTDQNVGAESDIHQPQDTVSQEASPSETTSDTVSEASEEEKPAKKRTRKRTRKASQKTDAPKDDNQAEKEKIEPSSGDDSKKEKPAARKRTTRKKATKNKDKADNSSQEPESVKESKVDAPTVAEPTTDKSQKARKGWWQRALGG